MNLATKYLIKAGEFIPGFYNESYHSLHNDIQVAICTNTIPAVGFQPIDPVNVNRPKDLRIYPINARDNICQE